MIELEENFDRQRVFNCVAEIYKIKIRPLLDLAVNFLTEIFRLLNRISDLPTMFQGF